jgi:DNA-binding transcriptional LysR family regulator
MADLRDMQLIAALARHEHFARAAEECGISQPAFSARIRNLEATLGVPMVKRGNRFLGFTPEGEIVLKWARRMILDYDGLHQEVQAAKGALVGRLSIGAVPTALTFAAGVPAKVHLAHPGLAIRLLSMSSSDIIRGIEDYTLDAGITYLDDAALGSLKTVPLYDEKYVLLVPPALAPRQSGAVTWREAADLPLCLLTTNMRNRQIIDEIFASVGAAPAPVMETNAFVAALTQVASGALATIAPALLADALPIAEGSVRLPLTEPEATRSIGLVMAERDPHPPALRAFSDVVRVMAR